MGYSSVFYILLCPDINLESPLFLSLRKYKLFIFITCAAIDIPHKLYDTMLFSYSNNKNVASIEKFEWIYAASERAVWGCTVKNDKSFYMQWQNCGIGSVSRSERIFLTTTKKKCSIQLPQTYRFNFWYAAHFSKHSRVGLFWPRRCVVFGEKVVLSWGAIFRLQICRVLQTIVGAEKSGVNCVRIVEKVLFLS
jgi:hypothetical protein